jgi:hypothetical protein
MTKNFLLMHDYKYFTKLPSYFCSSPFLQKAFLSYLLRRKLVHPFQSILILNGINLVCQVSLFIRLVFILKIYSWRSKLKCINWLQIKTIDDFTLAIFGILELAYFFLSLIESGLICSLM